MRPRLVAVATHPIQYQAPWFQALAQRPEIDLQVLYVSRPDAIEQGRGFGVPFQWDVPLLQGYAHEFAGGVRAGAGHSFFARRLTHSTDALRRMRPDVVLLTGWHA